MIHEILIAGALFFHPQEKDSIGVETINGKIFVIHRVEEKETLFAISRRYGASVESILRSNPGLSTSLEIGQILKVPYEKKTTTPAASGSTIHRVAAKETMFSISKQYGITVDELKQWNNLTDNTLSIGQELIVKKGASRPVTETNQPKNSPVPRDGTHTVATGETLYSISRQYGLPVAQLRAWNSLESDELKVGQVINLTAREARTATETTSARVEQRQTNEYRTETRQDVPPVRESAPSGTGAQSNREQTIRISESLKNSDEVVESGLAELIEGTEGNRKYLAMHRTAPVGTILKVRNEMNNREVFVRVMGKLPDTAVNDKLIIKLSRSAYDRLGAIDPRFRVELTYYK